MSVPFNKEVGMKISGGKFLKKEQLGAIDYWVLKSVIRYGPPFSPWVSHWPATEQKVHTEPIRVCLGVDQRAFIKKLLIGISTLSSPKKYGTLVL